MRLKKSISALLKGKERKGGGKKRKRKKKRKKEEKKERKKRKERKEKRKKKKKALLNLSRRQKVAQENYTSQVENAWGSQVCLLSSFLFCN
jgi:hypothetical protein